MLKNEKNEFPSDHLGNITSIKFNNNSNRLAISGNDGKITIFSYDENLKQLNKIPDTIILKNSHNNSINDISWSHPKFGNYIASCGDDNNIIIWKEKSKNDFEKIISFSNHNDKITSIEFAPYEYGLILLCSSLDGLISIYMFKKETNNWIESIIKSNHNHVNFISWGPSNFPINLDNVFNDDDYDNNENLSNMKFASCGDDNVFIWESDNNLINDFNCNIIYRSNCEIKFVSWMKYVIYSFNIIAAGCENGDVIILKQYDDKWLNTFTIKTNGIIYSVNWSKCGNYLCINSDMKNKYYQENLDDKFEEIQMRK
jgi:protein transport protein SEC13